MSSCTKRLVVFTFAAGAWAGPGALRGEAVQSEEARTPGPRSAPGKSAAEPATEPLPGPKFLNLRYNEDFSYLEGAPDSYRKDFFDPIKHVRLAENWRLTLGGEFRYRLEAETNKSFGATEPAQDTFHQFRYMLHADVKYRDVFRLFVQGIAAFDEDRDLAPRAIDENRGDLHQLFFDLRILGEAHPLTLRVGRQELLYGKQRFVSPLDWAAVRRRFDGVKLFSRGTDWDVDFWYVKPIPVQRDQRDRFNEDLDFYGAYVTYKGLPRHGVDAYLFALHHTADPVNPNGRAGDFTRYTLGSRFWGETSGFDYETELAGQWGHWAGDTIQAWSWTIDGGYTFSDAPWRPRLGAGFDVATGDDDPRDRTVGTFDQHFPLGHAYFGYLDLIGRQNIDAVNVNVSAWPVEKRLRFAMAYHAFWLHQDEDALYNAAGAAGRRDRLGRSDDAVGQELDLTLLWKVNVHQAVLLGYSHFWDGDFIQNTGASENAGLAYVQYAFRF